MTHQVLQVLVGLAVMVFSALTGWPLVLAILRRSRAADAGEQKSSGQQEEGQERSGQDRSVHEGKGQEPTGKEGSAREDSVQGSSGEDVPARASRGTGTADTSHGLRGGLWIGLLERFAATGAVLLGEYTILAAIVAVKGLGRFRELSTPAASERFVVGTLASLTWSVLLGVIGRGLLALLV